MSQMSTSTDYMMVGVTLLAGLGGLSALLYHLSSTTAAPATAPKAKAASKSKAKKKSKSKESKESKAPVTDSEPEPEPVRSRELHWEEGSMCVWGATGAVVVVSWASWRRRY
jgi:hypothetical protein